LKWERQDDDQGKQSKSNLREKNLQIHSRQVKKEREELKWARVDYETIQKTVFMDSFPAEYTKDLEFKNLKFNNELTLNDEYIEQRRVDQKCGKIQDYNFSGDQVNPKL